MATKSNPHMRVIASPGSESKAFRQLRSTKASMPKIVCQVVASSKWRVAMKFDFRVLAPLGALGERLYAAQKRQCGNQLRRSTLQEHKFLLSMRLCEQAPYCC